MANTFKAPFVQTNKNEQAVVTAIPASITAALPTNLSLIATAGANGALLTGLTAIPRATVTDTVLYLFRSSDGGTTAELISTKLMSSHTVAATTEIPSTDFGYTVDAPLRLEASERLYAGIGVALAGGIVFESEWGDF